VIGPVIVAGWVAGWLAAGRVHRLPAGDGDGAVAGPGPSVSVVVPVRNEAGRLPELLAALAADARSHPELIVVDDGSCDGSGELARRAGATVLEVEPPPGWTGKAWACWQGALHASGDVLVFLDADTVPAAGFVTRLAAAAAESGGMVSVAPTHRTGALVERASAVPNVVALMAGTGTGRPDHWWRRPVGFGPAVAVPCATYLAAGGHGRVRAEVAEDVALAQALAAAGVPVMAAADAGEGAVEYRMYPEGARTLVQGWTKNLAAGASKVAALRAAAVALWVTGGLLAAVRPLGYLLYAAQMAVLFRRAGRFGAATPLLYPLPLLAFVGLSIRSALRRGLGRPVPWRGRWVAP
jgi:4,4'-diaponeurosporenoate glycosyltransferase